MAHMGERRSAYKVLVRKPDGKKTLLRRLRHRWEDIKMDLQERGYVGVDWIDLAQDRAKWWRTR